MSNRVALTLLASSAFCLSFCGLAIAQCALDAQPYGNTCRVAILDPILGYSYRPSISQPGFCILTMHILGQPPTPGYRRETAWLLIGLRQTQYQVPCCNACVLSVESVAIVNELVFGAFSSLYIPPIAVGLTVYFQGAQLWWVSQPFPLPELPIIEATRALALTFR